MSRSVIAMGFAALLLALSGCSVTMYGKETTGGGSTVTSTGTSMYGSKQIGNALISGSFGTPPAVNATGGQMTLTGNAAGFLAAVLVIAGMMEVVDDWLRPAAAVPKAPTGSISHTCSCYGWQPETAPAPAGQQAATGF